MKAFLQKTIPGDKPEVIGKTTLVQQPDGSTTLEVRNPWEVRCYTPGTTYGQLCTAVRLESYVVAVNTREETVELLTESSVAIQDGMRRYDIDYWTMEPHDAVLQWIDRENKSLFGGLNLFSTQRKFSFNSSLVSAALRELGQPEDPHVLLGQRVRIYTNAARPYAIGFLEFAIDFLKLRNSENER